MRAKLEKLADELAYVQLMQRKYRSGLENTANVPPARRRRVNIELDYLGEKERGLLKQIFKLEDCEHLNHNESGPDGSGPLRGLREVGVSEILPEVRC